MYVCVYGGVRGCTWQGRAGQRSTDTGWDIFRVTHSLPDTSGGGEGRRGERDCCGGGGRVRWKEEKLARREGVRNGGDARRKGTYKSGEEVSVVVVV